MRHRLACRLDAVAGRDAPRQRGPSRPSTISGPAPVPMASSSACTQPCGGPASSSSSARGACRSWPPAQSKTAPDSSASRPIPSTPTSTRPPSRRLTRHYSNNRRTHSASSKPTRRTCRPPRKGSQQLTAAAATLAAIALGGLGWGAGTAQATPASEPPLPGPAAAAPLRAAAGSTRALASADGTTSISDAFINSTSGCYHLDIEQWDTRAGALTHRAKGLIHPPPVGAPAIPTSDARHSP